VVNIKICNILDLFEKALHLAWLTTSINWSEKMVGQTMIGNSLLGSAIIHTSDQYLLTTMILGTTNKSSYGGDVV